MIIYEYKRDHNKTYIFHLAKNINRRKFLKTIKLPPGYFANDLFSRIYDCLFSELTDLNEEYRKYHCREYATFNEFLQKKYNLPAKVAAHGAKKLIMHKGTSLFLRKEYVTGDYNLEMFIMSADGALNILNSVLGVPDED